MNMSNSSNRTIGLFVGCPDAVVNNVKTRINPNNPDVSPVVRDGRVLVPLRYVAECFGAKVDWDEATSTIRIALERKVAAMTVGSKKCNLLYSEVELEAPLQIINGAAMVPLRTFADVFDKYVFSDSRGLVVVSDLTGSDLIDEYIGRFMTYEKVSIGGAMASEVGYYGTCPESPDGSKIAYVVYDEKPPENSFPSGSLYICNSDLTDHKKIRDIASISWHDGACVLWIDNNTLAYMDKARGNETYIINTNGDVLYGPIQGYIGHGDIPNGLLPLMVDKRTFPNGSNLGPNGVYVFKDGVVTQVADLKKDIGQLKPRLAGGKNPDDWYIYHAQFSTDGTYMAIRLDTGIPLKEKYLISFKSDGTDIRLFEWNYLHQQWYDDSTVYGHDCDWNEKPMFQAKRWDRDSNCIEILAGVGNHMGISPDRKYFVSETQYLTNPVVMRLYRVGNTTPLAILMSEPAGFIWDMRTHVNPSFSRDGKKVYFNKPVGDTIHVYRADISNII
ncbi:MAG: hypothetical protein BWY15_00307 [Firmicutes bacterium ADurb.Bin193]|nr:MAG: hypothetical protein BWY15_00307 [Firmicutes bacterium ADurb.Bin193]